MEIRHLKSFRAVAQSLSFTKAAAELHYAQSSVTEQIQALEAELGTKLFERSNRKLRLTSAGIRLREYADQVLLLIDEAATVGVLDMQEPTGALAIGGLETFCTHAIPPVLAEYRALYGKVNVSVDVGNRRELYESVRRGELDVCFTFDAPPKDDTYASRVLFEERLLVTTPVGHRLSRQERVHAADLHGERFLATQRGCGFREMFDKAMAQLGPESLKLEAEVSGIAPLRACVAAGMGLALLPEMAVRSEVERGELLAFPLQDADFRAPATMTWRRSREGVPSLDRFLALTKKTVATRI
ncbi:LysR family transcriptional regulator [Streptomyces sp. NBC_01799]|uniref:LysR family transcriptional regulator n=1 Tax=Streptomyces sp. NBC_01800 TaxID=2975945 RepID=UPI002DDC51D2|nr:LysR family transcriptional regulator [Streptomyces sp. NBC_01800]WSA70711.1 LysR family transcriptional regulator [Streptomyces sp. NBC_01800]WSA79208.1 LysR family transcriptional regulator [Streptomyces sp. NBC_01799]